MSGDDARDGETEREGGAGEEEGPADVKEMTDEQVRDRIVELGFGGDRALFGRFLERLHAGLPAGTRILLRGSVITGERWADGQPFDAAGHGTSDLDVTLVGKEVIECWETEALYPLGLHTRPLCDQDTAAAPALNPLREELQRMVGRPVNFQGTSNPVLFAREVLLGQPYHVLVEPEDEGEAEETGGDEEKEGGGDGGEAAGG